MKPKFLYSKDETIFHPPWHIKSYGSIIQTQIWMQKCKWFFHYVIPQMFDKWETDQCYSALWEFLFYAQFVKFDNLIATGIHDWNKEWVNDNVRFWDWLDHMESQQINVNETKIRVIIQIIGQTDSITTTQSCYQIYTQTIKNICNINFIYRSL